MLSTKHIPSIMALVCLLLVGSINLAAAASSSLQGCSGANTCGPVTGRMGAIIGRPNPPSITLRCGLGSAPNTAMVYKPADASDKRFMPSDFKNTCVANAGATCADQANTADTVTPAAATSCCSCRLYATYCADFRRPKYVVDGRQRNATGSTRHVLVMPTDPCTGVENWNRGNCPGEDVWDAAWPEVEGAPPSFRSVAVNPVSRRSQHQMHLHVGEVHPNLLSLIRVAHTRGLKTFQLNCGSQPVGFQRRDWAGCMIVDNKNVTAGNNNLQVTLVSKIQAPAQARPFELAYGTQPDNTVHNVLWASTLVTKVEGAADVWAEVVNPKGPAECFFVPHDDPDLIAGCQ